MWIVMLMCVYLVRPRLRSVSDALAGTHAKVDTFTHTFCKAWYSTPYQTGFPTLWGRKKTEVLKAINLRVNATVLIGILWVA